MTHYRPADLDMANRHVAQGELHIVRQERIVTELASAGQDTAVALDLLRILNETQVEHRKHRAAIAAALDGRE